MPQISDLSQVTTYTGAETVPIVQAGVTKKALLRPLPNVKDFGATGAGVVSDQTAFNTAIAAVDTLYVPKGTYLLNSWVIPAGKTIVTDGFETVFQQATGNVGTPLIIVGGSDVTLGTCSVKGNISTDTGEQNLGIRVQANSTYGNLTNIRIGDVYGENLRGDVVYVGQATGYTIKDVSVGHVWFDNVLRNGVSIVSGNGISVASIYGTRNGFTALDVESNSGSGPCVNIRVGFVYGRVLGLNAVTAADYIDGVEIGIADLSPDNAAQSSPSYATGLTVEDGLLLRNIKRAKIGQLKLSGFNRCGAFVTYNLGELGVEMLEIDQLYMRNCSITDATYNSYFQGAKGNTRVHINYVDVDISTASKRAFDGLDDSIIRNVKASISNGAMLIRSSDDTIIENVVQSGADGIFAQLCVRVTVKNGAFSGARITSNCNDFTFENFTGTATFANFVTGDDHYAIKSTFTGDYYLAGPTVRVYTEALRFGAYHLWVDATGDLRIKSSAPTTDLDGTVVGTQT